MDYSAFSIYLSYTSYAGIATGLFGLLAAKMKKPIVASLFVLVALASTGVCFYTSHLASNWRVSNYDEICEITDNGKEIMH